VDTLSRDCSRTCSCHDSKYTYLVYLAEGYMYFGDTSHSESKLTSTSCKLREKSPEKVLGFCHQVCNKCNNTCCQLLAVPKTIEAFPQIFFQNDIILISHSSVAKKTGIAGMLHHLSGEGLRSKNKIWDLVFVTSSGVVVSFGTKGETHWEVMMCCKLFF
jgi:hypothetical protein